MECNDYFGNLCNNLKPISLELLIEMGIYLFSFHNIYI